MGLKVSLTRRAPRHLAEADANPLWRKPHPPVLQGNGLASAKTPGRSGNEAAAGGAGRNKGPQTQTRTNF